MRDIIIIGAGVVGSFLARELSKYKLDVLVLEKENDVGNVTSMANSAIVHSGYDPETGTNKAKFNVLGNAMFDKIADELDVHFGRIGSLTLAFNDEEYEELKKLILRSKANGVEAKLLSKEDTLKMEPNINPNVLGALLAPSAGIVNPFTLTAHAMENALDNGVCLHLNEEVLNIAHQGDEYLVTTNIDSYHCKYLINAAGLSSDLFNKMLSDNEFVIKPRKGEYFVLDHYAPGLVRHVIFRVPTAKGKGVLVSPTTSGNYIVGPSSEEIIDRDDFDTDSETLNNVKKSALEMIPSIPFREVIRVFSGLRATPSTHDFVIKESDINPGYFIVGGIESPGLVSSPAIAKYVVEELLAKHIKLVNKENYNPRVKKYIMPKALSIEEKNKLVIQNKDYGVIVCNCEQVTLGEIKDVLSRSLPCRSLKAIKKRTRAGFGKCQSGFCQSKLLMLLSDYYHIDISKVLYDNEGSYIVKEETKVHHE